MTRSTPPEDFHYIDMGPWPGFIAFTTSPKAFKQELKRLKLKQGAPFLLNERSHASTHYYVSNRGSCIYIICMPPFDKKTRTKESYAALLAHEAMHVVQEMQSNLASGKSLGCEAEAYLIQMIVQEGLQIAWKTGWVRAEAPSK